MTIRASGIDIMATLLEHGHPMTKAGLVNELGVRSTSINRAIHRLMARGLVEQVGEYTNPGTGRKAAMFAPGRLVKEWVGR
jgi:predicted transcriptional regulator